MALRPKAADIADRLILTAVYHEQQGSNIGANVWKVYGRFPDFPEKVVRAKLHAMLRRKLVTGCCCGCRGDFNLTQKGQELFDGYTS